VNELKKLVVAEVIKVTRSMLATAEEGRKNAIEESKYHKGAMQSRYDTFKEEAQYLMIAQDVRIEELNSTIAVLESLLAQPSVPSKRARVFSLVELEDEAGSPASYLILPAGGGVTCIVNEKKVTTINESSPLARALSGKSEGEETEIDVAGNKKTFSIIAIA
jgi:transcription elongation GreA/GreB family factor